MRRPRTIALIIAAVSLAALVASANALAHRIGRYNQANPPSHLVFHQILSPEFTFADYPVRITEQLNEDHSGEVLVQFGDTALTLRVTIPPVAILPDLSTHRDWLAVLVFREDPQFDPATARAHARQGIYDGRLVIVTRTPPPGIDPKTFGEVWRSEWWFDFYELKHDGSIEHTRLAYPESERALARRQSKARRAGEEIPGRRSNELTAGTWQYDAAMYVIPPHFVPPHDFADDALSAAGWTMPVVVVSMLTLVGSLAFGFGRGVPWTAEERAQPDEQAGTPTDA